MPPRILVVGDVMDDLIVRPSAPVRRDTDTDSEIDRRAGGSAANTACWLATAGAEVVFAGTVHRDDVDRHAVLLARAGVTARLTASATATGTIVLLLEGEARTMLTSRGANRLTDAALVTPDLLDWATHLHLTGYSLLDPAGDGWAPLFARASAAGVTVSVDPGSAGYLADHGTDEFRNRVRGVDVLLPNRAEAALLTGRDDPEEAAAALVGDHAVVAVTCGGEGALARTLAGGSARACAIAARVADPTGAGDAFSAGFLAAHLAGAPLAEALGAGVALGARAVETLGARPA